VPQGSSTAGALVDGGWHVRPGMRWGGRAFFLGAYFFERCRIEPGDDAAFDRLRRAEVVCVEATQRIQLCTRRRDRLLQYIPLDVLGQRRRGERAEVVIVGVALGQQISRGDGRHFVRRALARSLENGVERGVGSALFQHHADHRHATILGHMYEVYLGRKRLAVDGVLAVCVEVELAQHEATATDLCITTGHVHLQGVPRIDNHAGKRTVVRLHGIWLIFIHGHRISGMDVDGRLKCIMHRVPFGLVLVIEMIRRAGGMSVERRGDQQRQEKTAHEIGLMTDWQSS